MTTPIPKRISSCLFEGDHIIYNKITQKSFMYRVLGSVAGVCSVSVESERSLR